MNRCLQFLALLSLVLCACGSAPAARPTAKPQASGQPVASPTPAPKPIPADRVKFLGRWGGHYACINAGVPIEDQILIAAGDQPLELKLTLFLKISQAPVKGHLTAPDLITIEPQIINGATTKGSIRFAQGKLRLELHGLAADCFGEKYVPQQEEAKPRD